MILSTYFSMSDQGSWDSYTHRNLFEYTGSMTAGQEKLFGSTWLDFNLISAPILTLYYSFLLVTTASVAGSIKIILGGSDTLARVGSLVVGDETPISSITISGSSVYLYSGNNSFANPGTRALLKRSYLYQVTNNFNIEQFSCIIAA